MPDYTPVYSPGSVVTLQASATIVAGQVLMISGTGTVAPATAAGAGAVIGVAGHDAASGAKVAVHCGGVHDLVSQGAITAGLAVTVGSVAGTVATIGAATFEKMIGIAITTGVDTALVRVRLLR
jgi:hypothetical protein